jgi:hypothetical protein
MDGLELRMGGLESRMGGLDLRMGGFEARMDGLEARIVHLFAASESKMQGMLDKIAAEVSRLHFTIEEQKDDHRMSRERVNGLAQKQDRLERLIHSRR